MLKVNHQKILQIINVKLKMKVIILTVINVENIIIIIKIIIIIIIIIIDIILDKIVIKNNK